VVSYNVGWEHTCIEFMNEFKLGDQVYWRGFASKHDGKIIRVYPRDAAENTRYEENPDNTSYVVETSDGSKVIKRGRELKLL
jgi:hypothetical protein